MERYYFIVYSYWVQGIAEGKGNLSIGVDGFPSGEKIKKMAIKKVAEKYPDNQDSISVVVENIIEMDGEDFKQWTN